MRRTDHQRPGRTWGLSTGVHPAPQSGKRHVILGEVKALWDEAVRRQTVWVWRTKNIPLNIPKLFGTRDKFYEREFFHELEKGGWFQDDSSALHLLCTLFLLLLHQLHLRSSGIRSWRLGTPLSAISPGHGYQVTEASSLFACHYLEPSNKRIIPPNRNILKETVSNLCILGK